MAALLQPFAQNIRLHTPRLRQMAPPHWFGGVALLHLGFFGILSAVLFGCLYFSQDFDTLLRAQHAAPKLYKHVAALEAELSSIALLEAQSGPKQAWLAKGRGLSPILRLCSELCLPDMRISELRTEYDLDSCKVSLALVGSSEQTTAKFRQQLGLRRFQLVRETITAEGLFHCVFLIPNGLL